jgi:tRNA A-37 threonylcarbamoyl transferase component Bud32
VASATRLCPSCNTPLPELAETCYVCGSTTPPAIDKRTGEHILPDAMAPSAATSAEMIEKLKNSFGKHYELGHLIGRGGFAEVFQVRDLWLKRDLALKAIRPDLLVSETMIARFRREAEAVAALRHPSIVPIYDIGDADGIMYILMPLIKGESLKSLLVRDGRRPIAEARRIMLEATSALGAAHEAGIVHRDIKPENIMLEGKARRVLVMDFGIAKVMDTSGDGTLTTSGTIVGTPHYMSPEQASGDPHLDHRTDQYSLAVVAYHMLTGSVPFEGENTRAILFKQMMESPRSMRELVPEVPEALMEAVSRGMAKEPAERYVDMEGFAAAIEAASEPKPAGTESATPTAGRRSRVPAMLAGAGLLATAAIVVALVRRPPAAETVPANPDSVSALAAAGQLAESLGVTTPGADTLSPDLASPQTPASHGGTTVQKKSPPASVPGQRAAAAPPSAPTPAPVSKPSPTCAGVVDGKDLDLAFRICTEEAKKGNVVSIRRLAGLYDRSPIPGHDAEAVTYYRQAADSGDLPSLFRLGELLHLGKGIAINELDASTKIKKAAEAEYLPAWVVLGDRYEKGLGLRRSDKDAAFWYRRAAEKGEPEAQARIADWYMRGKGVDKDETEGVNWFRKAADQGNSEAQYGLGMAYLRGKGVEKSDSLGLEWLQKAAAQGHAEAQKEIAKRKS